MPIYYHGYFYHHWVVLKLEAIVEMIKTTFTFHFFFCIIYNLDKCVTYKWYFYFETMCGFQFL